MGEGKGEGVLKKDGGEGGWGGEGGGGGGGGGEREGGGGGGGVEMKVLGKERGECVYLQKSGLIRGIANEWFARAMFIHPRYKHYERWASAHEFPVQNIINDGSTTFENRFELHLPFFVSPSSGK